MADLRRCSPLQHLRDDGIASRQGPSHRRAATPTRAVPVRAAAASVCSAAGMRLAVLPVVSAATGVDRLLPPGPICVWRGLVPRPLLADRRHSMLRTHRNSERHQVHACRQ